MSNLIGSSSRCPVSPGDVRSASIGEGGLTAGGGCVACAYITVAGFRPPSCIWAKFCTIASDNCDWPPAKSGGMYPG